MRVGFTAFVLLMMAALASGKNLEPHSPSAVTVTTTTTEFSEGTRGSLERIVAAHDGIMGIYCRNLKSGETIAINADEPFQTASTIKLAVMCAAFDLLTNDDGPFDSYYDTKVYDASTSTGGSGFLRNYQDGTRMELKELMHLMITISDNTATNMLCEWIGLDKVNAWLTDHDFKQTRMYSTIGGSLIYDKAGREEWGLGRTTPREMGELMAMIATGKAGTPGTTDEMLRILGNQYFDDGIPAGIPPTVYVGSKSGSLNRLRADTAIVAAPSGTYVLAVFTKDNEDTSWKYDNDAEQAIRKVSSIVWHHYNPDSKWESPAGTENF